MKRIVFAVTLGLMMLSACGGKEVEMGGEVSSQSVIESKESVGGTSTAKENKASEMTNAQESQVQKQQETIQQEQRPVQESAEVSQATVQYQELSDQEQYEINIFLSNFAEQDYWNVSVDIGHMDINWLAKFAYLHTKINSPKKLSFENVQNESYYCISLDQFNTVADRFFGVKYTDSDIKNGYEATVYSFYDCQKFYFMAADGETRLNFAVADAMYEADGVYHVDFSVYEMDQDDFGDVGGLNVTKAEYQLRPDAATARKDLKKVGHGEATVKPYRYSNRNSYQLIKMTMKADN